MTTRKNVSTPSADTAIVRFTFGANELRVADEARGADTADAKSAVAMFDLLFSADGHAVPFSAFRKLSAGETRSNEEQAGWQFVQLFHAVRRCGAGCAAKLFDANVKGDEVLQREGVNPNTLAAYKPQAKRQIKQTIFGTTDFGAFIKRMEGIAAARDLAAKIAAGEVKEGEATKGAGVGKSDKTALERAVAKVNDAIKAFNREGDAEKADGSVDPLQARKVAALLLDVLVAQGWAAKPANK